LDDDIEIFGGKSQNMYIFSTRSMWLELGIPNRIVKRKFREYFGEENIEIRTREEAAKLLDFIIKDIQNKMLERITERDTRYFINDLLKIFDTVFEFYMMQKNVRSEMKKIGVADGAAYEMFEINKHICRNIIDSTNIWFENTVLHQVLKEERIEKNQSLNSELLLDIYIYGLASVNYSLLHIGRLKNLGLNEFYYGLDITPNEDIPAKAHREHPITYHNSIIAGNQNNLTDDYDLKEADSSEIGIKFLEKYGYSFLRHMAVLHFGAEKINSQYFSESEFLEEFDSLGISGFDANLLLGKFALTKENINKHLKDGEDFIWSIGINEHRVELKPFILLNNGYIYTTKMLLEQSKIVLNSYFLNGGPIYQIRPMDDLIMAFDKRIHELSNKLVLKLRQVLQNKYYGDFDEIEVQYNTIFGGRKINYGDFDLVFYNKKNNELFLIEAKFISDALNSSCILSDYDKMFKTKGYYDKCRRRYDLVISEPDKLKRFVGIKGEVDVHFLFITSKALEIELQDADGVVTFIGMESFEKYLDSKLESEDGSCIMRPVYRL